MTATTEAYPGRGTGMLAERAGLCGVAGGALWFMGGVAGMFVPRINEPGTAAFLISGVVATVSLVLLLVGFLGIAWGGALGGWIGKAFFGVAVLGYALMVVGGVQTVVGVGPLVDPEAGIALIYLLGRLISAAFALFTGVAILHVRRWRGWAAFTPLLVGLCPLVGELGFLIAFGQPNQLLNAAWGLFGALLGYAALSRGRVSTGRPGIPPRATAGEDREGGASVMSP